MSFRYFLLLLFCGSLLAEESQELTLPFLQKSRLDGVLTFQQLSNGFGTVKSGYLTYTRKASPVTSYLYNLTFITRKEGTGAIGQFGAYRDWTPTFYTFSALTTAAKADFLPRIRLDQEFYFKCGAKNQLVVPATLSFVNFYNNQTSFTLGTGILCYLPRWILEYRIIMVQNFPGRATALSHTASAGYGEEGWQWLFLSAGYGKNSYFANYDVDPEHTVDQRVIYGDLNYRRWLSKAGGIIGIFRYTNIKGAYNVYSGSLGLFREF